MKSSELKKVAFSFACVLKEENKLFKDVDVKFKHSLFSSNGHVSFDDDLTPIVNLNLFKLNKGDDELKILFNSFCSLAHEFRHSQAFVYNDDESLYNYSDLLVLIECGYYASKYNINFNNSKTSIINAIRLKMEVSRNYEFSIPELSANRYGYSKALEYFSACIDENSYEAYSELIRSIDFLSKTMQIYYEKSGSSMNTFSLFLLKSQRIIKEHPYLLERFPILSKVYLESGLIKDNYSIFSSVEENDFGFKNDLMLNHLLSFNYDYSDAFNDAYFKSYIENLIKDYIRDTEYYFKNINLGERIVTNVDVLKANLVYRKQRVAYLVAFAKKYGLDIGNTIILDSNCMLRNRKNN